MRIRNMHALNVPIQKVLYMHQVDSVVTWLHFDLHEHTSSAIAEPHQSPICLDLAN